MGSGCLNPWPMDSVRGATLGRGTGSAAPGPAGRPAGSGLPDPLTLQHTLPTGLVTGVRRLVGSRFSPCSPTGND